MIRQLRTRHRWFWSVAALALPVLYLLGLLLRPDPPAEDRLPEALQTDSMKTAGGSR